MTVNGADNDTFNDVRCQTDESFTSITIVKAAQRATVIVDKADGLVARSVTFNDIGGFTGSYQHDAQGSADVSMIDQTFTVTGTAEGFTSDKPGARRSQSFTIKAAC